MHKYDDEYDDLQRSETDGQCTHIRYFQRPNLPHIKTFLLKKTLSQKLNIYISRNKFNLEKNCRVFFLLFTGVWMILYAYTAQVTKCFNQTF
jgi:hypothetical protein